MVSGREPVQEERTTAQDEGWQPAGARQSRSVAGSVRHAEQDTVRGWSNYFCYGTRRSVFRGVDRYVYERTRDFLARRHKVAGRGTRRFSYDVVYGERGLLRLERLPLTASLCASRSNRSE